MPLPISVVPSIAVYIGVLVLSTKISFTLSPSRPADSF